MISRTSNITLKQLRAFCAVAGHGSFTMAANQLGLSQPALTMIIRQLEEEAGVSLFDRTTRRVTLSAEGEEFLPTATRLLGDFELAVDDLQKLANQRRGRVGVASVSSVATEIMPPAVREFRKLYPMMSLHLVDDSSGGVCRRVRRNEVDFGLASRDSQDPELDFTLALRDPLGLVGRADHPLMKSSKPLSWHELEGCEILGLGADTGPGQALLQLQSMPNSLRSPKLEVSNASALDAMLYSGLGVAVLPALAYRAGHRKPLRFRPIGEPTLMRSVYFVSRKMRSISRAAEAFKAIVLEQIEKQGRTHRWVELPDRRH